jgi:hypothetical protein
VVRTRICRVMAERKERLFTAEGAEEGKILNHKDAKDTKVHKGRLGDFWFERELAELWQSERKGFLSRRTRRAQRKGKS